MVIAGIVAGGIIIFIVAFIIGGVIATDPLPPCCLTCLHHHKHNYFIHSPTCCDHMGMSIYQRQIDGLREDNRILRSSIENLRAMNYGTRIYAMKPDDQQIVDLVINAVTPLNELKDKLGIK